jgi:hypothetical protein
MSRLTEEILDNSSAPRWGRGGRQVVAKKRLSPFSNAVKCDTMIGMENQRGEYL